MSQAFSDRLKERGWARTWVLVVADISRSVPQQMLELSLKSRSWTAIVGPAGGAVVLAGLVVGPGSPITLVGLSIALIVGLLSLHSLRASKRERHVRESPRGRRTNSWTWWTILAMLLATTYVAAMAVRLIAEPKGANAGALAAATCFAVLIVAGLRLRSQSRIAGNWMIAVGAEPALIFYWIVVPAVVGLAVIAAALTEASGGSAGVMGPEARVD